MIPVSVAVGAVVSITNVTAELNPPDSADAEEVYQRAHIFEGWVDGINATDGSGAHCHMSSVAICALLTRVGYSPVLQISCRDYNRIAELQPPVDHRRKGESSWLSVIRKEAGDEPAPAKKH